MRPRRVLTLAYHFPPLGGAGVQRMLQLSRRLPDLGWEQVVITGPGAPDSHWRPRDEGATDHGSRVEVVRLGGVEPPHDVRWEGRLERWLRASSRWRRWWTEEVVAAAATVGDVDLVHASLAPYSTAESAVQVARRLGRPLIVDLEDPWALDEMMVYPTGLHRRLERRRMGRILAAADVVVMNTREARERTLRAFPALPADRVIAVPNAFDADDFRHPATPAGAGAFRIVHTGSLHTAMGQAHRAAGPVRRSIGGAVPGVDFLTRAHVLLMEALDAVVADDAAAPVELHLAGAFTQADRDAVGGRSYVHLHEFLPHAETVALLQTADLLFLPMHDLPAGVRAGLVPHKTYEYLAAGRPVLAAVPEGDARDLLAEGGAAHICRPADVGSMATAIRLEVARHRRGEPGRRPAEAVVSRCEADRLARDFARVLDRLVPAEANDAPVAAASFS